MKRLALFAFLALVAVLLPASVWAAIIPAPPAPVVALSDDPLAVLELALQLAATRQWGLLSIPVVILLVKVGGPLLARLVPFFGSGLGKAVLALLGGTAVALLPAAIGSTPLTLPLVLSGLVTAVASSGLWSMSKAALEARAQVAGAKAAAKVNTVGDAAAFAAEDP